MFTKVFGREMEVLRDKASSFEMVETAFVMLYGRVANDPGEPEKSLCENHPKFADQILRNLQAIRDGGWV